ncbi:MAG: Grx4 family monothiol glutaredoxin [Proteobacteria bacterium]|nr:Grx4 family monothiol glutaredoxin [Pseudomonadota bacterium]MCP4920634.1 Grx4 family monothiol glutaredoxin [Pseudomonadota bacterium]
MSERNVQGFIKDLVTTNDVVLFMKGNKFFPACGFSARSVQILNQTGVKYETFDVLSDMEVRQGIKDYASWPTIPQLYVRGEFLGGSDIMMEMFQNGELATALAGDDS